MKLNTFEGEVVVAGVSREVGYDGEALQVYGVGPEEVLALLQHLSTMAAPEPSVTPVTAAPPPQKPRKARSDMGKVRTPAAKKNGAARRAEAVESEPALALVPPIPVEGTEVTTGTAPIEVEGHSDRLDKPPENPFVEDGPDTQATDAAARHHRLGEPLPDDLARAKSLKDVAAYFCEQQGVRTRTELLKCCEAWRDHIPLLARVGNLPDRIEGVAEMFGLS
jgi:hypothetical protein